MAELENHLVIMQDSYPDENRQLFFPTRRLRKAATPGKKNRFPFVPTLGDAKRDCGRRAKKEKETKKKKKMKKKEEEEEEASISSGLKWNHLNTVLKSELGSFRLKTA